MADVAVSEAIVAYTPPSNANELADLSREVGNTTGAIGDAPINVGEEGLQSWDRLNGIYDQAEQLRGGVVDLLNNPARFAGDARLVFDNLQSIDSPRDFAQSLFRIAEGLRGSTSPFGKLSRLLGLSRLVRLLGENPIRQLFLSRPSAEKFLLSVNEEIGVEVEAASPALTEVLRTMETTLMAYRRSELPRLPDVRVVDTKVPLPALWLSHRYYGNLADADAIGANVLHPGLVQSLEVRV